MIHFNIPSFSYRIKQISHSFFKTWTFWSPLIELGKLVRFTPCRFTLAGGGLVIGLAGWVLWLEEAVKRSSNGEAELKPGIGLSADGVPIKIKDYMCYL